MSILKLPLLFPLSAALESIEFITQFMKEVDKVYICIKFVSLYVLYEIMWNTCVTLIYSFIMYILICQGRIQDLIRGGAPDRDRPKTAILGPQFCRILVLGPHFWWSGGGPGPLGPPPWIRP